ncbi:MAG TPA: alanine racemase [Rhizomicrobium sp.]|jgi:alanine racemase
MEQPAFEAARLTIRLGALVKNYRTLRRMAAPAAVAGVVKADGYGTGAEAAAKALAAAGCDTFFVARVEEGVRIRPVAPRARIFVLDGAQVDSIPALITHNLTPVLNSLSEAAAWSAAAALARTSFDAAIHIDTGMSRLGLPVSELATLATEANTRLAHLRIVLVMSHLACADDPASPMNRLQLGRFRESLAMLPPAPASFASTGGVMLGKDYAFDLVRPGIGLYGGNPQGGDSPFAVVARLTGSIVQLRHVEPGETVGYGASFATRRRSTLATVALGYADGLMRSLGNRGFGAIDGHPAAIAGRVSMDLTTLDVTDVPAALLQVGTPVEFFGDTISLEQIAEAAGTANYEILTGIAPRVPRYYEAA